MSSHPDDLVSRFAGRHVAVIGDVMLDHFLLGRVLRISPEAPVPVVHFDRDEFRVGGAANVAHNIVTLGGQASLVGVVGDDRAAADLARELGAAGLPTAGLVADPARPTTSKVRVVTMRHQQVARIDYERDDDIANETERTLIDRITASAASAHALVLSDYRKGVVTRGVIDASVAAARAHRVPLLVDPKVPRPERYRGVTVITPNHHEAETMTLTSIRTVDDARLAARRLHDETGADVLITWGEHGMWVLDTAGGKTIEEALPAVAREVADVTGAGDTVIAVIALGLAAGARLAEAARVANAAAGLVVARFGPATLTRDELSAALDALGR